MVSKMKIFVLYKGQSFNKHVKVFHITEIRETYDCAGSKEVQSNINSTACLQCHKKDTLYNFFERILL